MVSKSAATDYAFIKKLIWAYFLLLLFEGALRKWFLPGLSQGLLIIRDPIVIWIYYLAYAQGVFPINNKYLQKCLQWVIGAAIISFLINQTHPFTMAHGVNNRIDYSVIVLVVRATDWAHLEPQV